MDTSTAADSTPLIACDAGKRNKGGVGDQDADKTAKEETAPWNLEPSVRYYPDTQTLVIENGGRRAEGEHFAKGVMVFYTTEESAPGAGAVSSPTVSALTIESAEQALKPFVDAILAKYATAPRQRIDP